MIKRLQSPTWRLLAAAGFLQSLGVILYCTFIAILFTTLGNLQIINGPSVLFFTSFLMLLVLSAAITGSLIFGYAAYLALNKKIKEALMDLAYVLLWSVLFVQIAALAILILIWQQPSLLV